VGTWLQSLRAGQIVIADELDASLHPILVRKLIEMFHDTDINTGNAQLIFNTHDTTLLDLTLFRRDQIWFVEKEKYGESHLYPLSDFSPRKDESLHKGYLQGRYGAIPFVGHLTEGLEINAPS
jgi:AAA15 family ATPase/GTPase